MSNSKTFRIVAPLLIVSTILTGCATPNIEEAGSADLLPPDETAIEENAPDEAVAENAPDDAAAMAIIFGIALLLVFVPGLRTPDSLKPIAYLL